MDLEQARQNLWYAQERLRMFRRMHPTKPAWQTGVCDAMDGVKEALDTLWGVQHRHEMMRTPSPWVKPRTWEEIFPMTTNTSLINRWQ
jgi:hypothetical protein